MDEYLGKEYGDLNEVASDNNNDKDDDDDANSWICWNQHRWSIKNAWQISKPKIAMKGRKKLFCHHERQKKIKLLNKNQSDINDYFMLE